MARRAQRRPGWLAGLLLAGLAGPAAGQAPAPVAAPPAAAARSIALWRLKPLGMDAPTAERLELLLRSELGRLPGLALQTRADTERLLAGRDDLRACGGETQCLCAIGQALGMSLLVTGLLGELGDDYTFDLKLVSVDPCRELSRINEAVSGREDMLIPAIRQALVKLVAPERHVGSLSVELPVEGAEIRVDGKVVGRSPLQSPIGGLRPGIHRLVVAKQGLSEFQEDVPVRFEQVTRVKVDLVSSTLTGLTYEKEGGGPAEAARVGAQAPPPPDASRLWAAGWGLTGVGLGLAAGAGILTWRASVIEREIEAAASGDPPYLWEGQADRYALGEDLTLAARIGWGVAGATLLTGAILLVVDAVQGDGGPEAGTELEREAEAQPAVGVLPWGPGLSVAGRF